MPLDEGEILKAIKKSGEHFDTTKQELNKIIKARNALAALLSEDNELCDDCKKKVHDKCIGIFQQCNVKLD